MLGNLLPRAVTLDKFRWVKFYLICVVTLVFALVTTSFADQSSVRLDDVQLSVDADGYDDPTLHASVRIDAVIPGDLMYLWLWYISTQPGFVPSGHTLQEILDCRKLECITEQDEHGDLVLTVSDRPFNKLIPGIRYFARAQAAAVNERDFDFEAEVFRTSYSSEFSDEVSFVLPAEPALRSDLNYFLIDNYYFISSDVYELIEETPHEFLYLPLTSDIHDEDIRDRLYLLNMDRCAPRPLPQVADVILFNPERRRMGPLRVLFVETFEDDSMRVVVERLSRFYVYEEFEIKLNW